MTLTLVPSDPPWKVCLGGASCTSPASQATTQAPNSTMLWFKKDLGMSRTGHQSSVSIGRCHLPSKLLDSGVTVSLKAPREDRIQGTLPVCLQPAVLGTPPVGSGALWEMGSPLNKGSPKFGGEFCHELLRSSSILGCPRAPHKHTQHRHCQFLI